MYVVLDESERTAHTLSAYKLFLNLTEESAKETKKEHKRYVKYLFKNIVKYLSINQSINFSSCCKWSTLVNCFCQWGPPLDIWKWRTGSYGSRFNDTRRDMYIRAQRNGVYNRVFNLTMSTTSWVQCRTVLNPRHPLFWGTFQNCNKKVGRYKSVQL